MSELSELAMHICSGIAMVVLMIGMGLLAIVLVSSGRNK